jgi:hypothetical protein
VTDEEKGHGTFDLTLQTASNVKETITNFGAIDEKSTASEPSANISEEPIDNELQISNVDEEKESLIETSKEMLAAPLQSAVDTYEKIVSTQEEPTSPTRISTKGNTSDYPWFASKYTVADSEIERLSATYQSPIDESDQHETSTTITSMNEETKSQDQSEKTPSQQLQVINDDYPWYSSYYTIADADANMGQLYKKLNYTIKQLEQRPPSTTVEFQPEPHEKVTTPDYDRQALVDTKDTREKVHELAQMSTILTTTTSIPQDEQDKDEDGFKIVQRRNRVPSSTAHEKTPPPTTTIKSPVSPDIDLTPVVIRRQPSAPITDSPVVSQTTTTTTTTTIDSKKKNKKQKKDNKETIFFDAPVPSISDINEQTSKTEKAPVVEERTGTAESELLPSSTTHDSSQIGQTLETDKSPVVKERTETIQPELSLSSTIHDSVQIDQTLETEKVPVVEERIETTESKLLPSSTTQDSAQIDQTLEIEKTPVVEERIETIQPELSLSSTTHESSQIDQTLEIGKVPVVEERIETTESGLSLSSTTYDSAQVDQTLETEESPVIEESIETTKSELLPSSTTHDSAQIEEISEEIKYEIEQLHQTIDEFKQKLADTKSEEQYAEPLSTSIISDIEELQQIDDEKNDSTSSDASQWLSSSFTTLPEDNKVDTQIAEQTEQTEQTKQTVVTETTTSISSTDHESLQPEILPISASTKKKKTKQKSTDKELRKQPEAPSLPLATEESNTQLKPVPPTSIKTTTTAVLSKIVVTPLDEEEVDDNEGFQIVSYHKRVPSVTGPEKTPPPTSTNTFKQSLSPDIDLKAVVSQGRQDSSTSVITPATAAVTQTTTTKKKPKKDTNEAVFFDAPLSSLSTDADIISSSSIDRSSAKYIEQQATDQHKKSSDTTKPKSLFSTVSTSSTGPSLTTEKNIKQRPKDQETILQSQIPLSSLSTVTETKVQPKSVLPPTTLRVKASTSPDEQEEEDNEGFQVVRYRKRTSSIPRSEKTLPPLPPKTSYKQNLGRNINLKPVSIHGRRGSETRSMPRTTAVGQISFNQRQQIRPKQDRRQIPPFSAPQSPASQETHMMSSFGVENQRMEQTKQPIGDKRQRMGDTTLQSSSLSTDQTSKQMEQQRPTDTYRQVILPIVQPKLPDQSHQQKTIETKTEQLSTNVSSPVDKSTHHIVQEYHVPTTDKTKTAIQQTSVQKTVPSTRTSATTIGTRKSQSTEEVDDDGFQIVRYRKHPPLSPTTYKQQSFGSETDKKPTSIPRRQSSPSLITTPASTVSQTTTPKKKPIKPKKSKEESVVSHPPQSVDILLSSTTDADLVSSSIEEFLNQTTTEQTQQIPESQITTEDVSSPRSEKEITTTTTTYGTITAEVNEPVQTINLTETVQRPSSDTQNKAQSTKSTTSPTVTSADTSEESSKKPKKKHKRLKKEPGGSEMSTPSDEIPSIVEALSMTKTIPSSSSTQAPIADIPLASSQIDETSDKITTNEETLPSPSIEPTTNIDDEQVTITSSKKPAKRRKKKAHTTEKEHEEENVLNSSTASTTDKDSSSAASATPVKQTSLESTTRNRLISDDDKQESEWITAQNKEKKSNLIESTTTTTTISQSNEQKSSSSPHSRSQPIASKIVPEKVTDVQFKFKKGGELTMISQSAIEPSPTEWGTVKFLSDEQDFSQPDKLDSSTEQIISQQLITENEPIIEQITDLTPNIDTEIKTELSTKSMESSETGGEADLDAYRDQTGRLRRKKPRKQTSHSTKPDDTSSTLEQQTTEEDRLDRRSISEHWADVLATPISNTDEEQNIQTELVQQEQLFEDEDISETNSKLDSFLPAYIRQQIKISSSPRSLSFNDDRSKFSSTELSTSISQSRPTRAVLPSSSNRSTSTDTSENESRKQLKESFNKDIYSMTSSNLPSATNLTENDTMFAVSSVLSTSAERKKKQRPKMLKKDIEAKTLLTHEFDDTPLTITEVQQTSPVTQITEDDTKNDETFLSSIHQQFTSAISTISDSFTSALASLKQNATDEQLILQSDESIPPTEDPSIISSTTPSESTTITTKKSSTRSPRKRSKRDSGPDYENLTIQSSGDIEQSFSDKKVNTTSSTSNDANQSDFIKVETHKQQLRQRTSSGRQISNAEEENEQQAILADDEEDEGFTSKPSVLHATGSGTNVRTSSESSSDSQDLSPTTKSRREQNKKKSETEEVETIAQVSDELKTDKEATTSDQQTTVNEQLRSVQGFHSFTPNKYQYNQYEEGLTIPTEQSKSTTTETESGDTVLSRGFNLWLQQGGDNESSPSSKKEEQSTVGSGLTRVMQSLIIQPVESESDDDDEEEDSWNGPRAKKPTYTTGIRIEKRIHTTNGYNINHPRSTTTQPSWLISPSDDNTYTDDPSKFDPDEEEEEEEEDSIEDSSDKQTISHTINTQLSTLEERQRHLNNLVDLTFQPTIGNLSSSSSSLSSAAKWNETSIRSDDSNPQQTSFTEDDVQRCLGEDFYRESLAVNTLSTEQRTLTSLDDLVLKPSQLPEDLDDDDDDENNDNQTNRNNNNNNNYSINFDEWAHFLERQNNQHRVLSSLPTSSPIEQNLSTLHECSYARVLDDDTLISDADHSNLRDYVRHSSETERQRYGDFSSLDDDSFVPESPTTCPLLSSNPEQQVPHRRKPSETFQRWRNQSSRDREESNLNSTNQTSNENQNDDEIIIYHSDGGLSRRVRPSS